MVMNQRLRLVPFYFTGVVERVTLKVASLQYTPINIRQPREIGRELSRRQICVPVRKKEGYLRSFRVFAAKTQGLQSLHCSSSVFPDSRY